MDQPDSFSARVVNAKLTQGERVIAEYIVNNKGKVCFMSSSDLARELNTSDTSVNRTAKALHYGSFGELQKELQKSITYKLDYSANLLVSPLERFIREKEACRNEQGVMENFSDLAIENLKSVFTKNDEQKIDRVVQILANSNRKYIAGYRPTADLANRFGFLLRMILDNVLVASDSFSFERLLDINEKDCFFIIDFNRYSLTAMDELRFVRERKAKIIVLTDRTTAPLAPFAEELLVVDVYSPSFFNSNIAPMFLLELISTKLAVVMEQVTQKRLDLLEPYFNSHKTK